VTSALPTAVIDVWHAAPAHDGTLLVLPDGCRDLIWGLTPGQRPVWWISHLFDVAEPFPHCGGLQMAGYRLHPTAIIDLDGLLRAVRGREDADADLLALIESHVRVDLRLAEALAGLADAPSVAGAARQLGVSERTLERHTLAGTTRAPGFWKNLARVRRAAVALSRGDSLAEIALEHGYADQAHMTREFRRWFTLSPHRFRLQADLVAQAATPGYR
jgi:AraC-like DNA-binding protein